MEIYNKSVHKQRPVGSTGRCTIVLPACPGAVSACSVLTSHQYPMTWNLKEQEFSISWQRHPDCHQYPATVFHEIKETLATVPPQLSAKYLQISHQSWCISFPLQVMISVQHRILCGNAANKRRPPFFGFVLLESVKSTLLMCGLWCWCWEERGLSWC